MSHSHPFFGAICPAITPFNQQNKIDFCAMEKHYQMLTDSKINGILVMGTIGEFVTMTIDERLEIIKQARQFTDLPLIINVSTTVVDDMVRLADAAFDTGYGAVMALPHYYFAQTSNQLYEYYKYLDAKFAGNWFIYNFPARTGCDVDSHLVARLMIDFPKFIGIKDTVDCASHTRSIVLTSQKIRKDFAVFSGFDEYFVPNLMNGGAGVLSGLNNVVPELFAGVMTAFKQSDFSELARLHKEISRLSNIYNIGDDFVTTIKVAVEQKQHYLEPLSRNFGGKLNEDQIAKIKELFNC
ncbi:dihydrodipicolinate synthase family protein [Gilliamella sp. Fer1-1]|jgi:2-dehydro-3-deoxy-D-pentonate aldolase|uniref:dihydrodipicolinate synthase family protein n=1 Tax=Gilliamella sp. Fer1-1 TaxID=3120240 RepID=UPI00080E8522|nr:dihydrodipicolinate synthase family protein [Gilliamella apicola]OCG42184.1 dihydrodipicolinate synthase family protein [Gilliamella apicola]